MEFGKNISSLMFVMAYDIISDECPLILKVCTEKRFHHSLTGRWSVVLIIRSCITFSFTTITIITITHHISSTVTFMWTCRGVIETHLLLRQNQVR